MKDARKTDALGIVIVTLIARRFLSLSDAQLRDLSSYLEALPVETI